MNIINNLKREGFWLNLLHECEKACIKLPSNSIGQQQNLHEALSAFQLFNSLPAFPNNMTDVMTELGVFYSVAPKHQLELISSPNWLKPLIPKSRPVWQPAVVLIALLFCFWKLFTVPPLTWAVSWNDCFSFICSEAPYSNQCNKPEASGVCWRVSLSVSPAAFHCVV